MKLFRKRRKNNKGFSLVEMICVIAILGLTSTAIGSTMIMSADNYQRGSAEVDVQKEAQTTTNLIGNLIVDAVLVYPTDNGTVTTALNIQGENITYDLTYDQSTGVISYKETVGAKSSTGVLAENVTYFKVGDGNLNALDFTKNKNVRVDLTIEKNGKEYMASYNTTARNGAAFNVGAEASAIIVCDTDIVLEPNQEYPFKVELYGNPSDENLVWGSIVASNPLALPDDVQLSGAGPDGATIEVSENAEGDYTFEIRTRATESIGGIDVPLDSKMVTVHIRRATDIDYTLELRSGVAKKAGAKYRVYGEVTGDNFDKVIGKAFDDENVNPTFKYIEPVYVNFSVREEGGVSYKILDGGTNTNPNAFSDIGRPDRPYIDIELTADMPNNSKIIVTLQSKHAMGVNKSGEHYADIIKECPITNVKNRVEFPSGIKRGNDNFVDGLNTGVTDLAPSDMRIAFGGTDNWYFRYREVGTTAWSPYYPTQEGGDACKFCGVETRLWELDKAYEIEVICMSFSDINTANPKLEFPQDPTLLSELQAQATAGWYDGITSVSQGWTADDFTNHPTLVATDFSQYGGSVTLGASEIAFGLGGVYSDKLGSDIGGFVPGFTIHSNTDAKTIDYKGVNIETGHYGYTYDVWRDNSGWRDMTIDTCINNYIQLSCANTSLSMNNYKDLAKGVKFRLGIVAKGDRADVSTNNFASVTLTTSPDTWALYNTTSNEGCIYFEVDNY